MTDVAWFCLFMLAVINKGYDVIVFYFILAVHFFIFTYYSGSKSKVFFTFTFELKKV